MPNIECQAIEWEITNTQVAFRDCDDTRLHRVIPRPGAVTPVIPRSYM
jgi:hypothetical protein